MTLTTTASRVSYPGAGSAGPFAFPFRIFAYSDLKVTKRLATGVEQTLAFGTGFTGSGAGSATGTITLTTALAAGETLAIRRAPPVTQPTSIRNQGPYYAATHEDAFDRFVMIDQKHQDEIDRSLKLGETLDPAGYNLFLPAPEAGKVMTGTGTGFSMSTLDSSAVALPGNGRTVQTLSAYLANNARANVLDFAPIGVVINTGINPASAIAAAQAAINTGLDVYFAKGIYACVGLTQSITGQVLMGPGGIGATIIKSGNGVILASTGDDVQTMSLFFKGESSTPAFTGDNVTFTGERCSMLNCGSQWAFGRAVKATGGAFTIEGGQIGNYQTADATATGYDVEIGKSGTATLYHKLIGIYSSQNTGGVLMTDVGGVSMFGGQIGKLTIKSGTSPAGVGSNKIIGTRILGAVNVEISLAVFTACAFGAIAITFAAGTAQCSMDSSNIFGAGHTITNNGNANNLIERNVSGGGTIEIKYGDDASITSMIITPNSGSFKASRSFIVPNNNGSFIIEKSAGGTGFSMSMSAIDNVALTNPVADKAIQYSQAGTAGVHQFFVNGNNRHEVNQHGPKLPTYTVATRPAAVDGTIIFVSDGGAGAVFQGRAGGAWVNLG